MSFNSSTPAPSSTPDSSVSSGGTDLHTDLSILNMPKALDVCQESKEALSTTVNCSNNNNRLEHGILFKINARDGALNNKLSTKPVAIFSLHIPTSEQLHKPLALVQDGLKWEHGTFDLNPTWSFEPATKAVADVGIEALRSRGLLSTQGLSEKPFLEFEGAFNKLYSITSDNASYLMRVSLPVDPIFKTWSEVSTIALLRARTSIPIPRVVAYSSSKDDSMGFEWMLMERVEDVYPMKKMWSSLSWAAKTKLVEDVASYIAQLFDVRTDAIGGIYQLDTASCKDHKESRFVVSRIVSMPFFWGDHISLDHIHRGPFTSSRDWLHARLQLLLHDCTVLLANPDSDDAEKEDFLNVQVMAHRLLKLLPLIFPAQQENFALHHDDLSHNNILLDHTGTLKAIVDWECTSTMPLFMCCQLPGFLQGRERPDKPEMEVYGDPEDEGSLYQEHLKDYELTLLREIFIKFMQAKYPAWAKEYDTAGVRAEFVHAVTMCDDAFSGGRVGNWLDDIEGGYVQSDARE